MMGCAGVRQLVTAYVDGELVGEDRAAFERHLETCASCRRLLQEEQTTAALLQEAQPRHEAPAALRTRVEEILAAPPRRSPRGLGLTIAAAIAMAVLAGWLVVPRHAPAARPPGAASAFAAMAADTHLRYARGQLPLEVQSDRPERVSKWFAGRVPFHLALPDYPVAPGEQKFYRLEGGRLVSFGSDYAAYVAYQMDEQPISLVVTSAATVAPEGGSLVQSGALTFHVESVAGLKVITWSDNGLTYALASDVAVEASRSCLVCHGSEAERAKVERFPRRPGI
jgi:mycothiol system anti-sigma-R factor